MADRDSPDPKLEHVDELIEEAKEGLEDLEGKHGRTFIESGEEEPVDDTIVPG